MYKLLKQKNKNNSKFTHTPNKLLVSGFTLVETLVSVAIFSVSILGLMSVLSDGIADINYSKKKIIATYLAEEGVEYIRNMRDTYALYDIPGGQTGWADFNTKLNTGDCDEVNGCYFNNRDVNYSAQDKPITNLILNACTSVSCDNAPLLYDITTGMYGYSGTDSYFKRKIKINTVSADETKVSSTVYWTQGSGTYQITFSENLFNWME